MALGIEHGGAHIDEHDSFLGSSEFLDELVCPVDRRPAASSKQGALDGEEIDDGPR
jgi:hypothetical protein